MIYLAHRAGSDLWPSDPFKQIDVLRWLNCDTAHFSRHGGQLFFQHYIMERFGMGSPDAAIVEESLDFFKQFASVLDKHLEGGNYVTGDSLTVADFGITAILPDADKAKLPISDFANIARWHDKLMALPAWKDPWPQTQSEAA
jgi:glutathione S-transferase